MQNSPLLEQLERFYNLWRESTLMYEEWSKARGLSYNCVMALYSIHENRNCCTQKMISQKWLLPKQTIHTILKDLERRGFLKFAPMPSDKRNKLIVPTAEGERYAEEIAAQLRGLELYVLEHMGLERVEQMNDGLALFTELFHKGAGKRP